VLPDPLSLLLQRFPLHAAVFHVGEICGIHDFDRDDRRGHFHLIRQGPVTLADADGRRVRIDEPTLLFMPRPEFHRLVANRRHGADVVCAEVSVAGGGVNPVTDALPALVQVPLAELGGIEPLLSSMQAEAFGGPQSPGASSPTQASALGRQAALDRLCELVLIRLLRHCMAAGQLQPGTLAGLADPRLGRALAAVHAAPARMWTLDAMADIAGLSRARFALRFHAQVGQTPAEYLARWRVGLAQGLLRAGRPLKAIAPEVGYGSSAALTRAFQRHTGRAPTAWLRETLDQIDATHAHTGS